MTTLFASKVATFGPRFAADLGLELHQVAGMFGNFGVETGGFKHDQELRPMVPGSKGGRGWAQWTGYGKSGRRGPFEAWCKANGLKPATDEASYGYVVHELRGSEVGALTALRRCTTVDGATESFMRRYERPGIPHLPQRKAYGREALAILTGGKAERPAPAPKPAPPPKPRPASNVTVRVDQALREASERTGTFLPKPAPACEDATVVAATIVAPADRTVISSAQLTVYQERLKALNRYYDGPIPSPWGSKTTGAIAAFQHENGLPVTGDFDAATVAMLMSDAAKPRTIAPERAEATAATIRDSSPIVRDADTLIKAGAGAALGLPTITAAVEYLGPLRELRDFAASMPAWMWVAIAAAALGVVAWRAYVIRERRVAMHRQGETA